MNDEARTATSDDVAELTRLATMGRDLIRDARGGAMALMVSTEMAAWQR